MPTQEEIFEKIKASQERMMQALKGAYDSATDDSESRAQLLKAIEKATRLRGKIYDTLIKEKPPKLGKVKDQI